jgi:2-C-methyl-D-erythritol 4-phosphate cytidylyltransferase/2-C-methyl-D-erythritol 2,4-cyclodiphosphate synthase
MTIRSVAAIVVAAGRGVRAGGDLPKQFREIGGTPVLRMALEVFARHPEVTHVQAVIHSDDANLSAGAAAGLDVLPPVPGGATRQLSVLAGLDALASRSPDVVLIHDAARPFLSPALISRAIRAAEATGAAIPVVAVSDTVRFAGNGATLGEPADRARLRLVQTPQSFNFAAIHAAHRRAVSESRTDFTDDAGVAEWAGMTIESFEGENGNFKLTTGEDFARAEAIAAHRLGDVRVGNGYDVHAFGPGNHVTLGGVRIPHDRTLTGHSDADVALHALVDAILGALAEDDIGVHFPPSDAQWRGASSDHFLAFAVERVAARGGRIAHLDVSIVCEAPRIGPYRDAIRRRIAEIAKIDETRIGVKATTSEGLGFVGRREGIAAYATATVRLPGR